MFQDKIAGVFLLFIYFFYHNQLFNSTRNCSKLATYSIDDLSKSWRCCFSIHRKYPLRSIELVEIGDFKDAVWENTTKLGRSLAVSVAPFLGNANSLSSEPAKIFKLSSSTKSNKGGLKSRQLGSSTAQIFKWRNF